jgi:hypothetical protein
MSAGIDQSVRIEAFGELNESEALVYQAPELQFQERWKWVNSKDR